MQLHFSTLLANPQRWQSLISDEIVWERPYAASLGKSTEIVGKARAIEHVTRFVGIFTSFQFLDVEILHGLDRNHAVACALARGQIKSTGRVYEQEFVVFLKSSRGRIDYLREYFDPLRMAWALAMDEANS
ncbi:phenazine biosynthesis protein [Paraburkholderia sp. SIMBA_049]